MICQWNKLMAVLPQWISRELDEHARNHCREIRLRVNQHPQLNLGTTCKALPGTVGQADVNHVINFSSRYSPWSAMTLCQGYLTAPGGHRIGVCGEAVMQESGFRGIRNAQSLCIRISRDYPGLAERLREVPGSILILGAPGWGKTTLLRDLIRQRADQGIQISVVDEREELFPEGFSCGAGIDILRGCPKSDAIEILLKTMGPQVIAVDEITSEADARALIRCAGCGVDLLATIHAASLETLRAKPIFRELNSQKIFDTFVILHRDKSWHLERRELWQSNTSALR